jgi:diguanylate cyclase (GGDEF)-like protein
MGSPIQQEGQLAGAVLVLHDVTREQNFMHQLNWQSRHDTLTGLENRSEFRTRLERLLSVPRNQSRPATLLHLDLDQFKLINDTSGHTAGDEVLREVCHCISRLTRDSDSVARLGGDEFAVLLHDYTPEQASVVAEKLRHAIQSLHLQWGTRILRTGVSIGMVHISGVDACAQDLLRMADMALSARQGKRPQQSPGLRARRPPSSATWARWTGWSASVPRWTRTAFACLPRPWRLSRPGPSTACTLKCCCA